MQSQDFPTQTYNTQAAESYKNSIMMRANNLQSALVLSQRKSRN